MKIAKVRFLDTVFAKRGRGRPARMRFSEIRGRAENYRGILDQVWDRLWPLLSKARTEGDVTKAFQEGASPYDREFVPGLAGLALRVLAEPTFPKRRQPQINFLADSLAGVGLVTPRRSRDICERHRAEEKRTILFGMSSMSNALADTKAGLGIMLAGNVEHKSSLELVRFSDLGWLPV
jgi:hypothetical protein